MTESMLISGMLLILILMHRGKISPAFVEAQIILLILNLVFIAIIILYFVSRVEHSILPQFAWLVEAVYGWLWIAAFVSVWLGTRINRRWLRIAQGTIGLLLLTVLITVLLHAAGYLPYPWVQVYTFRGYHRPHGLLTSPLEAGLMALIGWAWGLYWALQSDFRRFAGLFLTGFSTAIVYLTLSRSAWFGLGLAVIGGLLFALHQKRFWLPIGLTIGIFIVCSIELPIGWQRSIYAAQGDPSVLTRLTGWQGVATTLLRYPFGVPDQLSAIEPPGTLTLPGAALNFYLEIALAFGIVPLLLTGIIFSMLLARAWWLGSRGLPEAAWGLGTIATAVAVLFTYPSVLVSIPLGGLWGMVSAMEVKPDAPPRLYHD